MSTPLRSKKRGSTVIWALMALLFVGGLMNLVWIAALTAFVLAEKLLPAGQAVSRIAALVLAVWAVATFLV